MSTDKYSVKEYSFKCVAQEYWQIINAPENKHNCVQWNPVNPVTDGSQNSGYFISNRVVVFKGWDDWLSLCLEQNKVAVRTSWW